MLGADRPTRHGPLDCAGDLVLLLSLVLRCKLLGHAYRFWSDGPTMRWRCQRSCGAGSTKPYPTPELARRYAAALDREDHHDIGRRAPLGLTPLRIARALVVDTPR